MIWLIASSLTQQRSPRGLLAVVSCRVWTSVIFPSRSESAFETPKDSWKSLAMAGEWRPAEFGGLLRDRSS